MSHSTARRPGSARRGASRSAIRAATRRRWLLLSLLVSPPVTRDRPLKLLVIGTLGGFFSGLFGVGGGSVIVPLLIFWLAYGEREATGTSLAAIVLIGAYGTIDQAIYGNVNPGHAALVGDTGARRGRRRRRGPAAHPRARGLAHVRRCFWWPPPLSCVF